ncbi:hypothetical protein [Myxacorys almedinensis]|nr:hypothetical protein [Myxacorys almedinensis]
MLFFAQVNQQFKKHHIYMGQYYGNSFFTIERRPKLTPVVSFCAPPFINL